MKKILLALIVLIGFVSCHTRPKNTDNQITVSILPLKYFVDRITAGSCPVHVMVPPGVSPESYDPTTQDMTTISGSKAFVTLNLMDFERTFVPSLKENSPAVKVIDLSEDVEVISGHKCHHHDHDSSESDEHQSCACTSIGADPHIWLSVNNAKKFINHLVSALGEMYPDSLKVYQSRASQFFTETDSLDAYIRENVSPGTSFMIYHPSLQYLSNEYSLDQIAIENEGKEASVSEVKSLIETAKNKSIKYLLYQEQLSKTSIEAIASELKLQPKVFDPLAYNWIENIQYIVDLLHESRE